MKKILLLICAAFAMTMVSCNFEKDIDLETYGGKGLEFVHFEYPDDSWIISETDPTFVHGVVFACTYLYDKDVTYNIKVDTDNTTGVEGVDFSLPSKTVTIPAGSYSAVIPVEVLYETTGLGFVLTLALDVDDSKINSSYGNTQTITVNTDKITYDWDWLSGTWSAQDYDNGSVYGGSYSMKITKVDETTCTLSNLWGSGSDLTGTVDFDAKTITIPGNVFLYTHSTYGAMNFIAVDESMNPYDDLTTPVVATMSPAGISIDSWNLLLMEGTYAGYTWGYTYTTKLTR